MFAALKFCLNHNYVLVNLYKILASPLNLSAKQLGQKVDFLQSTIPFLVNSVIENGFFNFVEQNCTIYSKFEQLASLRSSNGSFSAAMIFLALEKKHTKYLPFDQKPVKLRRILIDYLLISWVINYSYNRGFLTCLLNQEISRQTLSQ